MSSQPVVTDTNYKPPPGRLGNLTPQQQEALDKLRTEIEQEGWFVSERMDDAMLLRYAHSFFGLRDGGVALPYDHELTFMADFCGPGNLM